ncbi:MAG: tRNA pseudouridine(13) synthase TruD [Gammaproteobacteria bacterium]|nr:tRNA pseudouridine(13) synthase TruD [Gammaproteobacteria bacterium]
MFAGRIRSDPADFRVDELLSIDFSGEGEHDWLRIEKTGANTHWVAEQFARHANVPVRDVGFSGLKDRHAITTQWFSVRRKIREPTDWSCFEAEGVRLLETRVHNRKLNRGTHRGNAFRIAVRASSDLETHRNDIAERLETLRERGVPNYFGEQRFGRDGGNLELGRAIVAGRRMSRAKRSIGISALRSFEFNSALETRVRDGTWNALIAGDVANLDGSGSMFAVDEMTAELDARCARLDIHPTGELPAISKLGVKVSHRPLRMRIDELRWELSEDTLLLEFRLGKGSYATAVLREIVRVAPATDH